MKSQDKPTEKQIEAAGIVLFRHEYHEKDWRIWWELENSRYPIMFRELARRTLTAAFAVEEES